MKRMLVLSAVIAIVGFALYRVYAEFRPKPSERTQAASEPVGTREGEGMDPGDSSHSDQTAEVALLRQQIALLRQELASVRDTQTKLVTARTTDATEVGMSRKEMEAAAEVWHAHMAEVQADFFREPRDSKWSSAMTSLVRSAADKNEIIKGALQTMECRSRTCRLEIEDDGSGRLADQIPLFLQELGHDLPDMQSEQVDNGKGQKAVVMYMTAAAGSKPNARQ